MTSKKKKLKNNKYCTNSDNFWRIRYGDKRLKRHLCNLHNEVFEAAESRINTKCSITMREGVSFCILYISQEKEFHHYA